MKKGILFDLDGTLWDSAEGVTASWNETLEKINRPERLSVEDMYRLMGNTMDVVARRLFPQEADAEAQRLMQYCMDLENDYIREHGGSLYMGLKETLQKLRENGYFLGIVSNCQEGYIEAFVDYHGLKPFFDDTENFGHTKQGKGYNIRLVVERNNLDQALYLGDTMRDYEAAQEAGIPFLHAAYGFGKVPAGTPSIQDIRELPEKVGKIL